ncbi:Na+/H+ antiporter subunit E [Corynebacterium uberis]|uniref:Na+/H+ antiporter subunit E n=1 Tax=Corynebacterium TaxID=1716 RepID=UPI001D09E16C|nr:MULTISPECIES: Na+/H+ antiporter subunit E [Corynebacterium]MCZ9309725.1 Na+/H+ antiporter subunit E [Corynebacterium sp. c6VSa_13]UDL73529.1 Na+/H+ antiporter subunit E [Corynebacterium uberis]UDL75591.1 Na+/H+ antiporter subunit E [Corynebacterium uberis]UDL77804.1 Na+/H+ antiporter subunit E [Corynebacterium uberis]UDL80087.1 Na+/H+ antiporter subunit E [Corynebacterium uberis]
MMNGFRHRFRPFTIGWIAALWCALNGEITWANVIGGLLVGTVIVVALPLPRIPTVGDNIRWGALVAFLGRWVIDLFSASFSVAWLALRRPAPPNSAIVRAPMRVSSELVLAFATGLYNLQPGGSVTDIDIANRMWTVHLLNARDSAAVDAEIAKIRALEADLISIFERG